MAQAHKDIYQEITNQIVAELEAGTRPWMRPWSGGALNGVMPLRSNNEPYKGINVVILWLASASKGYRSAHWMTYRQAATLGGQVRSGEKSTCVVYAGRMVKTKEVAGAEEDVVIPFMKSYAVFNADQIDGLPAIFKPAIDSAPAVPADPFERIEAAERFFAEIPAIVRHGGPSASYNVTSDVLSLPDFNIFKSAQAYYATRGHETIHWTRHPARLNRDFGRKRWGDQGYATEELVAELGSAFLCATLGLVPEIREDHAPYIASWLKVLKNDKRAIFTAATKAQQAHDYLATLAFGVAPGEAEEAEPLAA